VARDTKDEEVAKVLQSKDRTQSLLLKALLRKPQHLAVAA
jgi:hypothetical protein